MHEEELRKGMGQGSWPLCRPGRSRPAVEQRPEFRGRGWVGGGVGEDEALRPRGWRLEARGQWGTSQRFHPVTRHHVRCTPPCPPCWCPCTAWGTE